MKSQVFIRCSKCGKLAHEEFVCLNPDTCAVCSSVEPKRSEFLKRQHHIYAVESLSPN